MVDEVREPRKPFSVLEISGREHFFETIEEAITKADELRNKYVYRIHESRNRTDNDGFTDWRRSYEEAANKESGTWKHLL